MNAPLRVALVLAPIVALAGTALLAAESSSKPARSVRNEPPRESEDVQVPSEPSRPAVSVIERVTPPAPAAASVEVEAPSEDSLAATMHALEDSAPERALELAQRGQAFWPDGPRAPEFAATEVKCLYRLGRPSEGRGTAEAMVNKYPPSSWTLEVERQTGAHRYVDH